MAEASAKGPKEYSTDPEAVRKRLKRKRKDPDFELLLAQEHKCTKCPGLLHDLWRQRRSSDVKQQHQRHSQGQGPHHLALL